MVPESVPAAQGNRADAESAAAAWHNLCSVAAPPHPPERMNRLPDVQPNRPPLPSWPTWPAPGIPTSPEAWRVAPARSPLARSAGIVAGAFVLSRVLGLTRDIILARLFGTGVEMSAYVSAFRLPDLLFLVIMAGSFGSAFIPVFAGLVGSGQKDDAWRLASTVLNLSALAMAAAGAFAFVFADPMVRTFVAPGAGEQATQLTVETMRVLLLSPVFLGLGIAAKGILEAQDRFTLPALAPVAYNLGAILGALLLARSMGIRGVAIGVIAGAIGHLLVQVPGLIATGLRWRPRIDLQAPGLAEVGRLLGPRILGQAAFQVNFIVVTNLAWRSGPESASALNYAWQLLMLPHGVLALSISTVVFPTMARLFEAGDMTGLRAAFGRALKPLLFLSLPAAIVLYFFPVPIVQAIFQGGAFDAGSTALVAPALAWFAVGLIAYAAVEVLTRAFYAMHDTRTPVTAGIVIIAINIAIGASLVDRFGFPVLAFALSFSTAVEAAILLVILRRRLGGIDRGEAVWIGRIVGCGAAMVAASAVLAGPVAAATAPGQAPRLVQWLLLACVLATVGLVYVVAAWLLGVPEFRVAMDQVAARLPGGRRLASFFER
jgi:putative peptidoglycan lipid II flippase